MRAEVSARGEGLAGPTVCVHRLAWSDHCLQTSSCLCRLSTCHSLPAGTPERGGGMGGEGGDTSQGPELTSQTPQRLRRGAELPLTAAIWFSKNFSKMFLTRGVVVAIMCWGFFSFGVLAARRSARLNRGRTRHMTSIQSLLPSDLLPSVTPASLMSARMQGVTSSNSSSASPNWS